MAWSPPARADLAHELSVQAGQVAAYVDDDGVVSRLQQTYTKTMATPSLMRQLATPEGEEALAQVGSVLRAAQIRKALLACPGAGEYSKKYVNSILSSIENMHIQIATCPPPKNTIFDLDSRVDSQRFKDVILLQARQNTAKTKEFWTETAKGDFKKMAAQLKSDPQAKQGVGLLHNTEHISFIERDGGTITPQDVRMALIEIQTRIRQQENYLNRLAKRAPKDSPDDLEDLLRTNPAAVAQALLDHPAMTTVLCRVLASIQDSGKGKAFWNPIYFWGGMAVSGFLIATGFGSSVGLMVAGESATFLGVSVSSIMMVSSVVGGGVSGAQTIAHSVTAYNAYQDSIQYRSAVLTGNGNSTSKSDGQAAKDEAQTDLMRASFNLTSILPLGKGLIAAEHEAEHIAAELGLTSAVADKNLASTMESLASNAPVKAAFEQVSNSAAKEAEARFIARLSQQSPREQKEISEAIAKNPDRLPEALAASEKNGAKPCD